MAEVVLWIVLGKKTGILLLSTYIKGLVCGNKNSSVLLRVSTSYFGSIGTKDILKMVETLGTEFVAVANK